MIQSWFRNVNPVRDALPGQVPKVVGSLSLNHKVSRPAGLGLAWFATVFSRIKVVEVQLI